MESNGRVLRVTFEVLGERLLEFVRLRIQNGEYSERGLARILGISQPQMHNVLKGTRALRPALADRLLRKFCITTLELLTDAELNEAISARNSMAALERRFQKSAGAEGEQGIQEDMRRWRKPAARSARLNFRSGEKLG